MKGGGANFSLKKIYYHNTGGQFYNHTPMGSLEGPALTRGSSRLKDRSDKFRINIF